MYPDSKNLSILDILLREKNDYILIFKFL
uniref:Putative LOC100574672 [Acyrthosiphon pisum] n=1 Tax=Lepeophtheirus salmonis TaxID=72036 RepID=A0A0K2U643_LEPSM